MEKLTVKRPIQSPWFMWTDFCVCLAAMDLVEKLDFWPGLLCLLVLVAGIGHVFFWLEGFVLGKDVVIGVEGICHTGIFNGTCIPWSEITQAIACRCNRSPVLILLRRGGKPMSQHGRVWVHQLQNPCKLVYLPDDKLTREFVAQYYGQLDFERTEGDDGLYWK